MAWLKYSPDIPAPEELTPLAKEPEAEPGALTPEALDDVAAHLQRDPQALAGFIARLSPGEERRDGWTPFARRLFLEVVAETGLVSLACEYTGLSRQSAYALAARDSVFAAGWAAASHLARNPLADDLGEKARTGVVDQVVRDGVVVAERRRFDGRLSMAVLNRLDKRCDRAEELGSKHLALVRRWDAWLSLVGKGEDAAAATMLEEGAAETAQGCQPCQLRPQEHPGDASRTKCENEDPAWEPPGYDPFDNVWKNDDGQWMTTFPPPPGFDGHENRPFDGFTYYERACTSEEADLLEANEAAAEAEEREESTAYAEAERDAFFAKLREALPSRHPGLEPGPAFVPASERQADPGSSPG